MVSLLLPIKAVYTFSLHEDNMETMDKQTACTDNAGDQSSVRIDKQIWPFE